MRIIWIKKYEPMYRDIKGDYPPDWEIRRKEIFLRANGQCELCGSKVGRLINTTNSGAVFLVKKLRGAHIHHKIPISNGGNHSFENLQLLCEECHARQHPDIDIRGMINKYKFKKYYNSKKY